MLNIYFTIDPGWLKYPVLAVFILGMITLSLIGAFIAANLWNKARIYFEDRGWL